MSGKSQLTEEKASAPAEQAWQKLLARDAKAAFFYGVTTTGVFCRVGCASRRPRRENVRFFSSAAEAMGAGFRPCLRCKPALASAPAWDRTLQKIRAWIEANHDRKVTLAELGRTAGMSPFSVQRHFKKEMGVTPLAYQRALKAGALRRALKQGGNVTEAVYEAGYGSSSRAYEGAALGMTPARFAQGGEGEQIAFELARSPFGWMVVGATERGLCWLALAGTKIEAEGSLRAEFPRATLRRDAELTKWVSAAVEIVASEANQSGRVPGQETTLKLDLRGTAFQLRVWQALRSIPRGERRSYSELAREFGNSNATRAVARACAMNRVALFVPCHRVVGADGSLAGYRWGIERKQKLLDAESEGLG